jgi:hypothetical protein
MDQSTLGRSWICWLLLAAAGGLALTSCAKLAGDEAVSVTAINYTDQELNSYLFKSVDEPGKVAGGPPVGPYEGAGTMCCFSLPATWHPGIKVQLTYDWWNGSESHRQHITKVLEVPEYPDGQVGTLWALFYPHGVVEVVSSEFAPGHPKWPGRVKGWPKPSLEYRRKVWQEEYDQERSAEKLYLRPSMDDVREDMKKNWEHDSVYSPEKVKSFSGPEDPLYVLHKSKEDQTMLASIRRRIKELEETRP